MILPGCFPPRVLPIVRGIAFHRVNAALAGLLAGVLLAGHHDLVVTTTERVVELTTCAFLNDELCHVSCQFVFA